jgi:transcriptional regulator with XRE-family HTH domain
MTWLKLLAPLDVVNIDRYFSIMGTRKVEQGDVGHAVAARIRWERERRQLSLQALSERLAALGRPILPSGLSKIEQGTRRVDVDDLVALAAALETVPSHLLVATQKLEIADPEEYDEAVDNAVAALRRAEAAGASRHEVVEWMDQFDAIQPKLEQWGKRPGNAELAAALKETVSWVPFAARAFSVTPDE